MADKSERGITILTVMIAAVTLLLMMSPTGVVGSRVSAWRMARHQRQQVAAAWGALDSVAQRLGANKGKVRMFEFADYECPYCRAGHAAAQAWEGLHAHESIGFVHFPLRIHPAAEGAARAAVCADEVGRGEVMHRLLMTDESWRADTNWSVLARGAGVRDTQAFRTCLHAARTTSRLARSEALAAALGVTGTPTFISRNARAVGAQSVAQLEALR